MDNDLRSQRYGQQLRKTHPGVEVDAKSINHAHAFSASVSGGISDHPVWLLTSRNGAQLDEYIGDYHWIGISGYGGCAFQTLLCDSFGWTFSVFLCNVWNAWLHCVGEMVCAFSEHSRENNSSLNTPRMELTSVSLCQRVPGND